MSKHMSKDNQMDTNDRIFRADRMIERLNREGKGNTLEEKLRNEIIRLVGEEVGKRMSLALIDDFKLFLLRRDGKEDKLDEIILDSIKKLDGAIGSSLNYVSVNYNKDVIFIHHPQKIGENLIDESTFVVDCDCDPYKEEIETSSRP